MQNFCLSNLITGIAIVFFNSSAVFGLAGNKSTCKQYEGKLIAYYADVYAVRACKRHLIEDPDELKKLQQSGKVIVEVEADVIKSLPLFVQKDQPRISKRRSCTEFNNKYVTHTLNEVYFVQNCTKRLFVDWESYLAHRKTRGINDFQIQELSFTEFSMLKTGDPMPSETDKYFAEQFEHSDEIEVLSVRDACKGLNGKLVSFYSDVYLIEKCKKRMITDPAKLKTMVAANAVIEIDSSRFVSLPQGKPIEPPHIKEDSTPLPD